MFGKFSGAAVAESGNPLIIGSVSGEGGIRPTGSRELFP